RRRPPDGRILAWLSAWRRGFEAAVPGPADEAVGRPLERIPPGNVAPGEGRCAQVRRRSSVPTEAAVLIPRSSVRPDTFGTIPWPASHRGAAGTAGDDGTRRGEGGSGWTVCGFSSSTTIPAWLPCSAGWRDTVTPSMTSTTASTCSWWRRNGPTTSLSSTGPSARLTASRCAAPCGSGPAGRRSSSSPPPTAWRNESTASTPVPTTVSRSPSPSPSSPPGCGPWVAGAEAAALLRHRLRGFATPRPADHERRESSEIVWRSQDPRWPVAKCSTVAASPAPIPATSHAVARSGFLAGVVVAERLVARPQLPGPGGTGVCGQCRQTVRPPATWPGSLDRTTWRSASSAPAPIPAGAKHNHGGADTDQLRRSRIGSTGGGPAVRSLDRVSAGAHGLQGDGRSIERDLDGPADPEGVIVDGQITNR